MTKMYISLYYTNPVKTKVTTYRPVLKPGTDANVLAEIYHSKIEIGYEK